LFDLAEKATQSNNLFSLATGINEFDLLYAAGAYHLFFDDGTDTAHKTASTLAGLEAATKTVVAAGKRYPCALFDGALWHLWAWDQVAYVTKHYTCATADGAYAYSDSLPANLADVDVTFNPVDGKYYAAYMHVSTNRAGVLWSSAVGGSWTDLGYIFSARSWFHNTQETDPCLVFLNGRSYCLFGGWDGTTQRICGVELSATFKALGLARILVEPLETWQTSTATKIFNPVYLDADGYPRIYFSANKSAASAGWGYLELIDSPRQKGMLLEPDWTIQRNAVDQAPLNLHGAVTVWPDRFVTTSTAGNFYSMFGPISVGDFTLVVNFVATAIPTSGNYARVVSILGTNNAVIGLWIRGSTGKLYCEIKHTNGVNDVVYNFGATLTTGVPYQVIIRRLGTEYRIYVNRALERIESKSEAILLRSWMAGSQYNPLESLGNGQQFEGSIYSVKFAMEAIPLNKI
jgi:hypothetical protein